MLSELKSKTDFEKKEENERKLGLLQNENSWLLCVDIKERCKGKSKSCCTWKEEKQFWTFPIYQVPVNSDSCKNSKLLDKVEVFILYKLK